MDYREELDTPALIVREDILQHNLETMAAYAQQKGLRLRPHFKTHKTAAVAALQQELGAGGITVAKLGEAEALVDAGVVDDIFVANEVIGPLKVRRLLALMQRARMTVAVDTAAGAAGLEAALAEADTTLDVIIELNTGQNRAGVVPEQALALAETIRAEMPHLRVVGLMTHEGHAGATPEKAKLSETARNAGQAIVDTAEQLREHGFDLTTISVGSTPAAFETTTVEGITEMRPGTYVFNDATYFRLGTTPDDCALRVLATVTSRNGDRAVLDCGSKVLTMDPAIGRPGHGYIVEYPEAQIIGLSEEHGWVRLPAETEGFQVGEKVQVIPNHVCPAVNLADELYLVRDGEVIETWPVIARGKTR